MKHLTLVLAATAAATITLSSPGFAQAEKATKSAATKPRPARPLNVALMVYKDVEALDLAGPMDVFVVANTVKPGSYNVYTVGVEAGPIAAEHGVLTIRPRYTLANCPQPDILVVPGAPMGAIQSASSNRSLIQGIGQKAAKSRLVMSVCTGSFLLGRADLLNNRNSTSHWFVLEEFQKQFPLTTVMQGVRFVEDGKFLTTAGVSSGIDGALHVVEKTSGKPVADVVSRAMQYRRGTPAYPEQPRGTVRANRVAVTLAPRKSGQKLFSNLDPICHMAVNAQTKFTHEHRGQLYGFCSEMCRETFAAHPAQYVK